MIKPCRCAKPGKPYGGITRLTFVILVTLSTLMAGGCGSTPAPLKPALPRLDQLKESNPEPAPLENQNLVAVASLTRIWLPADQSIDSIWRQASTISLSEMELAAWHDNQLRAAVVKRSDLKKLLEQLPIRYGVRQQVMTLSQNMTALDPASVAAAHRPTSVVIHGKARLYTGGRMQLLIAADPQSGHVFKLTIVPHQHVPKISLLPRDHVQAALDGTMFPELMLRAQLSADEVLLIGPDIPQPVYDDTRPTTQPASTQPASTQPAATQPVDAPLVLPPLTTEPAPIPFGLGHALLTGTQLRMDLHQLLILEVQQAALPQ